MVAPWIICSFLMFALVFSLPFSLAFLCHVGTGQCRERWRMPWRTRWRWSCSGHDGWDVHIGGNRRTRGWGTKWLPSDLVFPHLQVTVLLFKQSATSFFLSSFTHLPPSQFHLFASVGAKGPDITIGATSCELIFRVAVGNSWICRIKCKIGCQNKCRIKCQKGCQVECQNIHVVVCHTDCQNKCQIECHTEWYFRQKGTRKNQIACIQDVI